MVHDSLLQGERLLHISAADSESGPAPADCVDSYIFGDDVVCFEWSEERRKGGSLLIAKYPE